MPPPPLDADPPSLAGLRVGIDARVGAERGAGVATYAATLAQALERLGARPVRISDIPATDDLSTRLARWARAAGPGVRPLARAEGAAVETWRRRDLFREAQVHFNLHGRPLTVRCADPPAIMHWTYPLPLVMAGTRNVYTLHDAIPLTDPALTGIDPDRHRRLLRAVGGAADLIVTVSEHSRLALEAVLRPLGVHAPIVNTYQTVPPAPPASAPPAGLTPAGLTPAGLARDGYLLACGQVEPRKNLARLIAAHRASGTALPLVIAGPDGWRARAACPAPPPAGVIRLGWLEREAMDALMAGARALLFPSLAEGFGLPLLEAMAMGVPVVTSDRGALAEVAGGAALTVDPEDEAALARAIGAVSGDARLRADLRARGLQRNALFAPDAYAMRLAAAYAPLTRPRRAD